MIDINAIRREPGLYRRAISTKRIALALDHLLAKDEERRTLSARVEEMRRVRNLLSAELARASPSDKTKREQAKHVSSALGHLEADLRACDEQFHALMSLVPSLPASDVPEGETDRENVEIKKVGAVAEKTFFTRDHIKLAILHSMLDLEGARAAAGSRAYALTGNGALLELALLRFALDFVLHKNFTPVLPPLLVNEAAMYGTGYFPVGKDDAYAIENDGLYLAGTSEVGIVAMNMNRVFDQIRLPMRLVGTSTCFRREAGAAGKDTRGLYRVHQFQKVEQVVFCQADPKISESEHFALLENAEQIVQALELPYRVVSVCTGDLGLGQVRKHDIETWMPSRKAYGETHSCSTFHDFQARRLNIRYKPPKQSKQYVHTLNNTALATPRMLIALLENHQQPDGSIYIPAALRPYLNGREILSIDR